MADINMPQLGETVTEGTVTRWLKAVGDQVAEDEVLFEVSTDKVDSEVPSPASGYLAEILVPEGETVDVGVRLAVISPSPPDGSGGQANGSEAVAAPGAPAQGPSPAPQGAAQQAEAQQVEAQQQEAPQSEAQQSEAPARASGRRAEAEDGAGSSQVGAPQPGQAAATPMDAPPAQTGAAGAPGGATPAGADQSAGAYQEADDGGSRVLSPVVRRLINEHHLDPAQIEGTGAGGRITRADVLSLVDARSGANASPPAAGPARGGEEIEAVAPTAPAYRAPTPTSLRAVPTPPAPASRGPGDVAAVSTGPRDEVVPFSNIRRRTAEHMVRSKATSAHTLVAVEVDFEAIERTRGEAKDRFKAEEGVSLTYLPFVARAVIEALRDFPHLNASVGDDALIVHHDLHLGIAVDLEGEGLIVPVVHQADGKRLRALAREMADLAARARGRRLTADDIAGGTFTITNPGPFGTFLTVPIINQPQVAILSTDGVRRRPVVVTLPDGSEGIAIHSVGMLALSFDHRAVDGAYASRFLAKLAQVIQTRDWAQEL